MGVAAAATLPACLPEDGPSLSTLTSVSRASAAPIPAHRELSVAGLHAYADADSVTQGGTLSFAVSSDRPYTLEICRLGTNLDDPAGDEVLETTFEPSPVQQPIHPGSYVHVEDGLPVGTALTALTMEIWVRAWVFDRPVGLLTQLDQLSSSGVGLSLGAGGSILFELGDGGAPSSANVLATTTGRIREGQWEHICGVWDGSRQSIYLNGVRVATVLRNGFVAQPGNAPLRFAASGRAGRADSFLNGDLATPIIYLRALSESEIQARVRDRGLTVPHRPAPWAGWRFHSEHLSEYCDDETGQRRGRMINRPTRMIGGPNFDANIGPFTDPFLAGSTRFYKSSHVAAFNGLPATTAMNAITLECWVRIKLNAWNETPQTWTCLVGQLELPNHCGYGLSITDQMSIELYIGNGGAHSSAFAVRTEPNTLQPGFWYHVVGTYDGTRRQIFINGERVTTSNRGGTVTPGRAPLRLGAYSWNGVTDYFTEGDLRMVTIYDRAVPQSEIRTRFADRARTAPVTGVLACYPLDESGGELCLERTGQRLGHLFTQGQPKWMRGCPGDIFTGNSLKLHPGDRLETQPGLDSIATITALSVECWVRPYSTNSWAGVVTQHDYPARCGFGLFLNPNGGVSFYVGDGLGWQSTNSFDSPNSILSYGQWHHLVGTYNRQTRTVNIFVNGVLRFTTSNAQGNKAAGAAPIRIGAYLHNNQTLNFLNADICMPVIHSRALTQAQVTSRFNDGGRTIPSSFVTACWPLSEGSGTTVADSVGFRTAFFATQLLLIAPIPAKRVMSMPSGARLGNYSATADVSRGYGMRFNSDDLYDCRWNIRHIFTAAPDLKSALYVARFRLTVNGAEHLYHVPFGVRSHPQSKKPSIVVMAATNTWRAYGSVPFAGSFPSGAPGPMPAERWSPGSHQGTLHSPGQDGVGSDIPKYSLYRPHRRVGGELPLPTYQVGLRMPMPAASPYAKYLDPGDYSHLLRQERHTHAALAMIGKDFDVLTDSDLTRDPTALFGYDVVIIPGHSEYWTEEMYRGLEAFLTAGRKVLALTANALWWRVSHDVDYTVMECRKIDWDLRGGTAPKEWFGEAWHQTDLARGGLMRECSLSGLHLLGVDFLGYVGAVSEFGQYEVTAPGDSLFHSPNHVPLTNGRFPSLMVGHEFDITFDNMKARMLTEYRNRVGSTQGYFEPVGPELAGPDTSEYSTIRRLGRSNFPTALAFDYFARGLPGNEPQAEAELIDWPRPSGGRVVTVASVDAGRAFHQDAAFQLFVRNVLAAFGV